MIRQNIVLGDYAYIVDLYKGDANLSKQVYNNYVMLRKYTVFNEVIQETDLIFIQKDILFNDYDNIVWPITKKYLTTGFSRKVADFSDNIFSGFFDKNLSQTERNDRFSEDIDTYLLRDKNGEETKVLCDTVRIYHPAHKVSQKYIIYFDNIVNNIHIHYFCLTNETLKPHSETEFRINNSIYSEYIEFNIPNIDYLFSDNILYDENINYWEYDNLNNYEMQQNCPLKYLLFNYKLKYNENLQSYMKKYVNCFVKGQPFQLQINCTLFPYSKVDGNKIFMLDSSLEANSDTFVSNIKISLIGKLSFNNGKLTAEGNFIYTNADKLDSNQSIENIYCSLLNFNLNDYITPIEEDEYKYDIDINDIKTPIILHDDVFDIEVDLNSPYGIIDNYENILYSTNNSIKYYEKLTDDVYDQTYKSVTIDYAKQNAGEIPIYTYGGDKHGVPGFCYLDNFFKYMIEIASDPGFRNIVYYNSVFDKHIENFNFSLDNIFTKWSELPECLVARVTFVDMLNSISFESNIIPITKEYFKYFINENTENRININDMKIGTNEENALTQNITFDFIDKINCIIKTNTTDNETSVENAPNTGAAPIVLYKPIFYRVNTAQAIQIRNGVQQNIGINLNNYMTKVETFKLQLDNKEYIEYARNDVYVIFKINANELENVEGLYNIMNEDNEYITYGAWIII